MLSLAVSVVVCVVCWLLMCLIDVVDAGCRSLLRVVVACGCCMCPLFGLVIVCCFVLLLFAENW